MIPMLQASALVRAAQSSASASAAVLVARPHGVVHVSTDPLTPSGRYLTSGGRTVCRARTRRLAVLPRGEAARIFQERRVCARCIAHFADVPGVNGHSLPRDVEKDTFGHLTIANLRTVLRSCTIADQTHHVGRLALMLFGPEPLAPKTRRTPAQQELVDLHAEIRAVRHRLVAAERTEEERADILARRADETHNIQLQRQQTRRAAAVATAQERQRAGRYLTPHERELLNSA